MVPALGLAAGCALTGIALLGDLRQQLAPFVALFLAAFVCYAIATWRVLLPAATGAVGAAPRLRLVLAFAALFRLIMLVTPPTLSDDLYRYIWEGRVLLAGQSPYARAPNDPGLTALRDTEIWTRVNNKDVPSPYPPVAQLGGMLAAWLTPHGVLGMKLVSLAGDVGVIGALLLLLRNTGRPSERVLVYAWHPLTALEFGHSAHNDSLMVAPLVLALALAAGSQFRWGGWGAALAVAVAALAKVTPLLLLPLLPRRLGVWPATCAGLVVAAAWVSVIALGGGDPGSIIAYLGSWQDNDSIHALLRELLGARAAKLITLGCLVAGVMGVAFHPALRGRPLWWQAYVVLGLSIVLASTVHAWYLTWLLPLLALRLVARRRMPFLAPWDGAAWLVLSGLVALPYLTYDTHEWRLWISFAQYVPFYTLLGAPLVGLVLTRGTWGSEAMSKA